MCHSRLTARAQNIHFRQLTVLSQWHYRRNIVRSHSLTCHNAYSALPKKGLSLFEKDPLFQLYPAIQKYPNALETSVATLVKLCSLHHLMRVATQIEHLPLYIFGSNLALSYHSSSFSPMTNMETASSNRNTKTVDCQPKKCIVRSEIQNSRLWLSRVQTFPSVDNGHFTLHASSIHNMLRQQQKSSSPVTLATATLASHIC